jgi:hypothetical protein
MLASSYGQPEVASLLLTRGAKVNHLDKVSDLPPSHSPCPHLLTFVVSRYRPDNGMLWWSWRSGVIAPHSRSQYSSPGQGFPHFLSLFDITFFLIGGQHSSSSDLHPRSPPDHPSAPGEWRWDRLKHSQQCDDPPSPSSPHCLDRQGRLLQKLYAQEDVRPTQSQNVARFSRRSCRNSSRLATD